MLSTVSISPRIGRHKHFELLHMGNALNILFLLEPSLDCRPVKVQPIALANKRDVVTPHCSVHGGF